MLVDEGRLVQGGSDKTRWEDLSTNNLESDCESKIALLSRDSYRDKHHKSEGSTWPYLHTPLTNKKNTSSPSFSSVCSYLLDFTLLTHPCEYLQCTQIQYNYPLKSLPPSVVSRKPPHVPWRIDLHSHELGHWIIWVHSNKTHIYIISQWHVNI